MYINYWPHLINDGCKMFSSGSTSHRPGDSGYLLVTGIYCPNTGSHRRQSEINEAVAWKFGLSLLFHL